MATAAVSCGLCLGFIGVLLLVILLPLSHQDLEYYQYGFLKRRSTGSVMSDKQVYSPGRHWEGPDFTMKTYQKDAHFVDFKELSVFSAGSNSSIGLEFLLDVSFTYIIIKEELEALHEELQDSYEAVVDARARDGIKNVAALVDFTQYFEQRVQVEGILRQSVAERLLPVHVNVMDFNLGHININEQVREKQLETRMQYERNEEAFNKKLAQAERDATDLEVASINLQATRTRSLAESEANYIRQAATAEADQIEKLAAVNGFASLYDSLNITEQKHKASFDYLRTIMRHDSVQLSSSFVDRDNVVRTASTDL